LICAVVIAVLDQSRTRYHQQATLTVENLSAVLYRTLTDEIEKIDLTLLAVKDELNREIAAGGVNRTVLETYLVNHSQRLPEALGVRVTDSDGIIQYAISGVKTAKADISAFPHFQRLKNTPDAGLVISKPLQGVASGEMILVFARRYDNADGSFGGQLHVAVPIKYFRAMFAAINLGPHGAVALWDATPSIIVRQVRDAIPGNDNLGTGAASPQLTALLAADRRMADYSAISGPDGIARRLYFRKIDHSPFYLNVGIAEKDYLVPWRQDAIKMMGLVLAFAAATLSATAALCRNWRHLEGERNFLGTVLHSIPNPVWHKDSDGVFTTCNPAFAQLAGRSEAEIVGRRASDLTVATPPVPFDQSDQEVITAETPITRDEQVLSADGEVRIYSITKTAMRNGAGDVMGILGVAHDMTEHERAELRLSELVRNLDASNQELEQFAYVASHDLREPLRMISSYLSLLERRYGPQLTEEGLEFLDFARDGAKRMDRLVLDLLDFSRIDRRGAPIIATQAAPALDQAVAHLAPVVTEAGTEIEISDSARSAMVMADQGQLVRLFQNLIGNAVKYRAQSRPSRVQVDAQRNDGFWEFSITDNGIGIEEEYFDRIFGIFQRLHTRDTYEGTGIGLAICKRIVERHGGRIWVASKPDQGSQFSFTLPVA
jgi:PAS domain S-box-containing protein